MRILSLAILTVWSSGVLAAEGGGERIQYSVHSRDCESLQTQEVELREFQIRGDTKNFTRRHEHVAFCEVNIPGLPDLAPIVILRQHSQFHVMQINGARVRFAVARKCFARETVSNMNRDAEDPTLSESTKIAQAECLSRAKQILELNSELKLDFEIKEGR